VANYHKGEVSFKAGGKTLIFRMGVNQLLDFQGKMGFAGQDEKLWEALDDLRSLSVVRTIVFCGLAKDQPDITEEAAGDIISELGLPRMASLIVEGLRWALPEKKEPGPGDKGEGRPSDGPTSS
jgi:hypothetical protein